MPPKWILIWFQLIKLLSFHTKYNPATARAVGSNSPPVSHSLYIYLRCWALVWVACWHRSVVWVGICDFYVSTRTPQLRQTLYDVAIQLCIDKYVSILFRIIFVNKLKVCLFVCLFVSRVGMNHIVRHPCIAGKPPMTRIRCNWMPTKDLIELTSGFLYTYLIMFAPQMFLESLWSCAPPPIV